MSGQDRPFNGKLAVVTGGSSGIGLATATRLSSLGASVWLVARNAAQLDTALAKVRSTGADGQRFGVAPPDVTDLRQVRESIQRLVSTFRAPDILVNCAGDVHPCLFCESDDDIHRRLMDLNYFGAVNMIRAVLPSMLKARSGHIVNVSSVYGFLGGYGYSSYCASKFALRGFSDSLRAELKPEGINVSVVFPQNTRTPQLEREEKLQSPIMKAIDNTPSISAEDVAKAITQGILKKKYVILAGSEARMIFMLSNVLGTGIYSIMDHQIAMAQKKAH